MLSVRCLTDKLRSQSLNEEVAVSITSSNFTAKSDLDRDSGTESDDELMPEQSTSIAKMEPEARSVVQGSVRERTRSESGKENSHGLSRAPMTRQRREQRGLRERDPLSSTPSSEEEGAGAGGIDSPVELCLTDSALPSDSDHPWGDQHSSEEELECINGGPEHEEHEVKTVMVTSALRFGPSAFGPPNEKVLRRGFTLLQQGPEKRKWAQVNPPRLSSCSGGGTASTATAIRTRPRSALFSSYPQLDVSPTERSSSSTALALDTYSASSDDEVQALIGHSPSASTAKGAAKVSVMGTVTGVVSRSTTATVTPTGAATKGVARLGVGVGAGAVAPAPTVDSPLPVQFRTSPPEGAHRPMRSLSPPPKLFVTDVEPLVAGGQQVATATVPAGPAAIAATPGTGVTLANGNPVSSPRKRHRHAHRPHNIQRPCLDFEKMQQMKNRSVSTWRHDGELSLFCW